MVDFRRYRAFTARLLHEFKIDRPRGIVVADRVRQAGDAKPVGCEDFWLLLNLYRQSLSVVLPIRTDRGGCCARHILLFEHVQQIMQSSGPATKKIDPLKFAYAE